ncbi:Amino acid permease family protein [Tritrichomonas foetus]|uniref:Amino acid permease family protein n=1 Tax=Tritrichomonas foetus TaxID=1144522 RepID=A0A1J4JY76_9EUKA|nr:Amino acid permease family protein [Tritrichomonas foetus]|eukprot:OHT03416.1 Amino acid permease family protein [Tritrichomonas foetus]
MSSSCDTIEISEINNGNFINDRIVSLESNLSFTQENVDSSFPQECLQDAAELIPTLAVEKNNLKEEKSLERGILSWHVSLISLGGIIGSCYFLGLGLTFSELGPVAVLIAYFIAGVAVFGVMQSFSELLVNIPRHGSFVSYNREFLGDLAAAGIGWAFWANWVVYVPSECLAFATFMNNFYTIPFSNKAWSDFVWGMICLIVLTCINLYHVKWFGYIESFMSITKILAIVFFVICAVLIFFGFIGGNIHPFLDSGGIIGDRIITSGEGSLSDKLFPKGGFVIFTYMIWTLVNFQGSEIVGLSASETQNPEVAVPQACKSVATRIIMIYLIPVLCLVFIVPHDHANLEESIFAYALTSYGLGWAAKLFTFITLIAAFSCANSGLYGTVRCMYGLSVEGMAPKFLSNLNRFNAPQNATLFTLAFIWIVFIIGFLSESLHIWGEEGLPLYANLLGISGFTGTLAWVGIILSQIVFRLRLKKRGYTSDALTVKAMFFPYLEIFSVLIQLSGMVCLLFEDGGIIVFAISAVIIFLAVSVFFTMKKCDKVRTDIKYAIDEACFDNKYPPLEGSKEYFTSVSVIIQNERSSGDQSTEQSPETASTHQSYTDPAINL